MEYTSAKNTRVEHTSVEHTSGKRSLVSVDHERGREKTGQPSRTMKEGAREGAKRPGPP